MKIYLDTSVVISLFVAEASSAETRKVLRQNRVPLASSDLVRLEIVAALSLKVRTGQLSEEKSRIAAMFADQWLLTETECLQVERRDFEGSRAMLNAGVLTSLKAPDALHLAISLRANATIFSNDKPLLKNCPRFWPSNAVQSDLT